MRSWLSLLVLLCCGGGRTSAGGGEADLRVHRCAPTCGSAGAAHLRLRGGGAAAEPAVTAYEVTGRVDYDRLVRDWGSQRINETLIERMESLTGCKAHHLIRRGFFFSHRDLDKVLDAYERGEPFYLYTGRGPSSESLHVGHLVPFQLTQWLQAAFRVPVVIQITDDEKFLWKGADLEVYRDFGLANVRDILAVGFDPERTYVLIDTDQIATLYPNMLRIQRLVSVSVAKRVFGFDDNSNIGQLAFPAIQIAPALSSSFPDLFPTRPDMWCLIPCAIDQDPYFRLARDVAPRLSRKKPALIHSKFVPALQGEAGGEGKMSASADSSAIFLTDSPDQVKKKVNKYAFSGGQASIEEHRRLGGDPSIDVSYRYLEFFFEDDHELARIAESYRNGSLLSGEMKVVLDA